MKQLLHLPFDRGIDQNKDTNGGEPVAGLRECSNLWHSRTGVLSTRPGTARLAGEFGAFSGWQIAAAATVEETGIALAGRSVFLQSRPRSTENEEWVLSGGFSAAVPTYRRDVGPIEASHSVVTKHVAIWRHLMLTAHEESGPVTVVRAYDRTTGAQLSTTTIPGELIGGWAHHSDAHAPTLWRRDSTGDTDVRRYMIADADLGTYEYVGESAHAAGLLVCGHDDGSAHVAATNGVIYYYPSPLAGPTSSVSSGATNLTTAFSRGDDGIAWFAGITGGTLRVAKAVTTAATSDSTAATEDVPVLCMRSAGPLVLMYDSVAPSTTYSATVTGSTGAVSAESVFVRRAYPLGGALYERASSVGYCWFRVNTGAASDAYTMTQLVDISNLLSRPTALDADAFTPPLLTAPLPQSAHDAELTFATLLPARTDLGGQTVVATAYEFTFGATRQVLGFLGKPYIPGGALYDVTDEGAPTTPEHGPVIASATQGTTGALTQLGVYQYVATYVRRDAAGVVRESAPSEAFDVTLTSTNDSVSLTFEQDDLLPDGWEIAVYRTTDAGTIFYRISLDGAGIDPGDSYNDEAADTTISDNAILYTESNALFNDSSPSHSFGAVGKQRVWLGGLWRPYRLQFSKQTIRGEVPTFPDDPSHWLDLESDVTAVACMDDVTLAFHRQYVDLISGDGPDQTGAGSFNVRPCTVGIGADDWCSVVVTPIGVFFAGNRTIWLMGRGFAAPENIGAMVRDVLAAYPTVLSAVLADYGHQQCVQFLCSNGTETTRLVFSLRTLQWHQWDGLGAANLGTMFVRDERRVCLLPSVAPASDAALLAESESITTDEQTPATETTITTAIETHQVHAWGIAADARVNRVWVRARTTEAQSWTTVTDVNDGESEERREDYLPKARPGYQIHEIGLRYPKVQSLGFSLTAGPVSLAGLMLEIEGEGAPKLATQQRRG